MYTPGEIIVRFHNRLSVTDAHRVLETFFELSIRQMIKTKHDFLCLIEVPYGREEGVILMLEKLSTLIISARRNCSVPTHAP